jgi:hypothetical protein
MRLAERNRLRFTEGFGNAALRDAAILQIPGSSPVRSDRDRSRLTPEAGLLKYWKGGECGSVGGVLFLSIPANLWDTGHCVGVCRTQSESIFVQ